MLPRETLTRRTSHSKPGSPLRTPTGMKSVIWPTPASEKKRVTSTLVSGQ